MDPIPFTIASAVAAGLVVAVSQLYRRLLDSDARCHAEKNNGTCCYMAPSWYMALGAGSLSWRVFSSLERVK